MTAPHSGKPALPPAAETEILERLYSNMQISADEVAAILKKHGVSGDASACLQLIVQQLNNLENSKVMLQLLRNCSVEQLTAISQEGFTELKSAVEKQEK